MKGLFFLVLTVVCLTLASSALAESTPSSSVKPRPAVRQGTPLSTEKRPLERLSAVKRVKVMNFSNNMIVRLEAVVDRLQILIDRIDARLVKIDESDKEVDSERAKELLDEAKAKLAVIKVKVAELKVTFGNLPDSEDPKSQFVEVREEINEVKVLLKELHSMLVGVVGNIKGLRVESNSKDETREAKNEPAVNRTDKE